MNKYNLLPNAVSKISWMSGVSSGSTLFAQAWQIKYIQYSTAYGKSRAQTDRQNYDQIFSYY